MTGRPHSASPRKDSSGAVRVLLVDDHAVVRDGVRYALEHADTSFEVVAEAASTEEARDRLVQGPVDLAVIDAVLDDGDGIQLCRDVRADYPATSCVILADADGPSSRLAALLAGAAGFLPKTVCREELAAALTAVADGAQLLTREQVGAAVDRPCGDGERASGLAVLSDREREVFELIGQGLSNRQIAGELYLTEKTVKNYVSHLLAKLHMTRRTQAAVLAARLSERRAQALRHLPNR